ncbi:hypothetical protein C2845_PM04G10450 [Panicum miliaceum]|uniref:Reverse transcriptase domain-containing protein n=1 Tax=Panicum miliaceum TaxID=4540 RepID=A0A3L6QME1_PANMI|nr:hypothetical protein C2845_PM04G10450 [Panicum miliaceum]
MTGHYFKSGKGVRQGDPLSPLLFNIAADTLAKMIEQAQGNQLIKGLVPEYVENGITILQYADDTILSLNDEEESARNMKLLLYMYEQMSGLKINFEKSEVLMVSQDERKSLSYSDVFNCATGTWPIKYLGVPVSVSRLHVLDWLKLDEKILKRLDGWQGSSLSVGGRLTLINSRLSSIPTYSMSMYLLPETICKRINKTRKFFWRGEA